MEVTGMAEDFVRAIMLEEIFDGTVKRQYSNTQVKENMEQLTPYIPSEQTSHT